MNQASKTTLNMLNPTSKSKMGVLKYSLNNTAKDQGANDENFIPIDDLPERDDLSSYSESERPKVLGDGDRKNESISTLINNKSIQLKAVGNFMSDMVHMYQNGQNDSSTQPLERSKSNENLPSKATDLKNKNSAADTKLGKTIVETQNDIKKANTFIEQVVDRSESKLTKNKGKEAVKDDEKGLEEESNTQTLKKNTAAKFGHAVRDLYDMYNNGKNDDGQEEPEKPKGKAKAKDD